MAKPKSKKTPAEPVADLAPTGEEFAAMVRGRTTKPSNDTGMTASRAFRGTTRALERAFLAVEALQKVPRRLTREAWRAEFEAFVKQERR